MSNEKFIEMYNAYYYLEEIKKIDHIFKGNKMKEFAEHCIKFNNAGLYDVTNRYTESDMDNAYDKGFRDGNQRDFTL